MSNGIASQTSNEDVMQCPDCKSSAGKVNSDYYCPTCKEFLATDTAKLRNLIDAKQPYKITFDHIILPAGYSDLPKLVEKVLQSPINNIELLLHDEVLGLNWLDKLLSTHTILKSLSVTWKLPSDPHLNTFSTGLRSCNNLTSLSIYDMQITKGYGKMFGEAIQSLTSLKSLCFENLAVVDVDEARLFSLGLKASKSINTLIVAGYPSSAVIMDGAFEENKSIEKLIWTTSTSPSDAVIKSIFSGLTVNKTLKELEVFSDQPLDQQAIKSFAEFIGSNESITSFQIETYLDNDAINILSYAFKSHKTLQSLNLSNNGFTSVPATIFEIRSLTELYLGSANDTTLESGFTKEFSEALRSNKTLKKLSIPISTNDGCRAMADGLRGNNTISYLQIVLLNIDYESLQYLGAVLATHPSLKNLIIGDAGAPCSIYSILIDIIKKNTTLESIAAIGMYHENIDRILDALKENNTLKSFETYVSNDTCVLMDGEDTIIPLFEVNYTLIQLDLFCSPAQKFLERNRKYQQEMYENTRVIIHSIARDSSMKALIPPEIWINIFKHLSYPGWKSFESMARATFKKYK